MYELVESPVTGEDRAVIRGPAGDMLTVAEFCERTDILKKLNILKPQPETDAVIAHGVKNFTEELCTLSMKNLGPARLEVQLVPGETSQDLKVTQLPGSAVSFDVASTIADLESLLKLAHGRVPPMLLTFTAEGTPRDGAYHFLLETRSPHQKPGTPNIDTTEFRLPLRATDMPKTEASS